METECSRVPVCCASSDCAPLIVSCCGRESKQSVFWNSSKLLPNKSLKLVTSSKI